MSTTVDIEVLKKLSVEERIRIIDALLDSIHDDQFELSPDQLAEMERRLSRAVAHPEESMTLEEFKARVQELI